MDGVALLREARAAGLTVQVDGAKLIIRGPKRLERLALRLLTHKPELMAALRGPMCPRHPLAGVVNALIHGGQSTRRDCAECGRFVAFTRWYGASQN